MKKILGMGNALTDILIQLPNEVLLEKFGLVPGSMQLITPELAGEISDNVKALPKTISIGGSASNTVRTASKLGIKCGFIGKICEDDYGIFFRSNIEKCGIEPFLAVSETMSGFSIAMVSPDGERTFATCLGAASQLSAEDINDNLFDNYDLFHIEGYLVQNYELIEKALKTAKYRGLDVSLDLASFNVVEENLDFLKYLVKNYVDIVFANEDEARAFTSKDKFEAVSELAEYSKIAIVKIGAEGSLIKYGNEFIKIDSVDAKRVDTTAAGDFYAAGFLNAYIRDYPLDICGKAGSFIGSKIIEVLGADFTEEKWQSVVFEMNKILDN